MVRSQREGHGEIGLRPFNHRGTWFRRRKYRTSALQKFLKSSLQDRPTSVDQTHMTAETDPRYSPSQAVNTQPR